MICHQYKSLRLKRIGSHRSRPANYPAPALITAPCANKRRPHPLRPSDENLPRGRKKTAPLPRPRRTPSRARATVQSEIANSTIAIHKPPDPNPAIHRHSLHPPSASLFVEKEVGVSRRCWPASVPLRKACPTAPSCTGRPWRWGWAHSTGTGAHGARIKSVARRRRSPIQGEGGARLTGSATSCRVCVRRQRAVRPMAVYAHTADGLQWPYTPQIARRAGLLRDNELGGGGWEER